MSTNEPNPKRDNPEENKKEETHSSPHLSPEIQEQKPGNKPANRAPVFLLTGALVLLLALLAVPFALQIQPRPAQNVTGPGQARSEQLSEPVKTEQPAGGVIYTSNQQGHISALNAQDGKLLWQVAIKDTTTHSFYDVPASTSSKVFVRAYRQDFVYTNAVAAIYVLSASDGKLLWSYRNANLVTVKDGKVFAYSSDGIFALRESDGAFLWNYAAKERNAFYRLNAVSNGVIYGTVNPAGLQTKKVQPAAFALNAADGRVLWRYATTEWAFIRAEFDGTVYVAIDEGDFGAIRDGKLLWKYTLPGGAFPDDTMVHNGLIHITAMADARVVSNASAEHDISWQPDILSQQPLTDQASQDLFASQLPYKRAMPNKIGKSTLHTLRLTDGTPLWSRDLSPGLLSMHLGLSEKDGILYASVGLSDAEERRPEMGFLYALQSKDGKELWSHETTRAYSELRIGEKSLFMSSYTGEIAAFSLSDGAQRWNSKLASPIDSTPLLLKDNLYAGISGKVYALSGNTGAIAWQYPE